LYLVKKEDCGEGKTALSILFSVKKRRIVVKVKQPDRGSILVFCVL
jgi:hypothetical protein